MGAGILPISIKNNKLYFLFGEEGFNNKSPGYSDFGGGRSEKTETDLETAIREGNEELHGFLYDLNKINKKKFFKLKFQTYTIFLILIKYDINLPLYPESSHSLIEPQLIYGLIMVSKDFSSHSKYSFKS